MFLRLLGVLLVIGFVGCGSKEPSGPPLFAVKGKLTAQGTAIADCNVHLEPVDPRPPTKTSPGTLASAGRTNATGEFTMIATNGKPGVAAGKYKVVLSYSPETTQAEQVKMTLGGKRGKDAPVPKLPFSKDYTKAETSPKEFEVTNKAETLNLAL